MNAAKRIAELFQQYLGGNWSASQVQAMMDGEDTCVIWFNEYSVEFGTTEQIIAAATARLLTSLECYEYNMPYPSGFMESALVLPEYQGKGIGKKMLEARIEWLKSKGIKNVCALAWESGAERTSRPLLESAGFSFVTTLEHPWSGEQCPKCGDSCKCNASLMKITLGE